MSRWPATKAKRVLAALLRIGWSIKRQTGSHRILEREGYADVVFAFHDGDEIGRECWHASHGKLAWNRTICSGVAGRRLLWT
jgi:predicted RNA binding protein YcfA (HicA-like mRNA interferase family)